MGSTDANVIGGGKQKKNLGERAQLGDYGIATGGVGKKETEESRERGGDNPA